MRSKRTISGKAVASLVLGLASPICLLLTGIPAVLLAYFGLRDIDRSRGRLRGKGLALTGLVSGSFGVLLTLLVPLVVPYVISAVREAAVRLKSQNNLKQIVLAMHLYHDAHGCLPPAVVKKDGKALYGWRVLLLPYLGENALYQEFHLDEPWDSPHNQTLLGRMPAVYSSPGRATLTSDSTVYQVFASGGAVFEDDGRATSFADITDGLANTILVFESTYATPWTAPQFIHYGAKMRVLMFVCEPTDKGFNACFADGTARFIPREVGDDLLNRAITRNAADDFVRERDLP
jgi:hypothetical protein